MQLTDRKQENGNWSDIATAPDSCLNCVAFRHAEQSEYGLRKAVRFLSSTGKQSGSALVISLIILIILMLLGIAAMNISDTQYKLAGNLQFENMAMNNAESAVIAAEQLLEANAAATPSASAVPTSFDPFAITDPYTIGYVSTNASPLAGVGLDCFDPSNEHNFDCVHTYLITARGEGGRGATKFVQVYYAVPLK
ncbi:MAG TPA: PilX N-terminal domain-containing pilus assembly protein [Gallionella sp.]|nr:PilX N-terminal domain-containing pilus assembly protein [Gallionella sp.]